MINNTAFLYYGAHLKANNTITEFRLKAPAAREVYLVKTYGGEPTEKYLMKKINDFVWEAIFENNQFAAGHTYHYLIISSSGKSFKKLDPYAFQNINYIFEGFRTNKHFRVHAIDSVVPSSEPYQETIWTDQQWLEDRKIEAERHHSGQMGHINKPMNIYELHPLHWKKKSIVNAEDRHNNFNYRELAPELVQHCKDYGYNYVELFGIFDYPWEGFSWGYQVSSYFAPNSRLGGKEDFQYLVNYLHNNHIGVIIDAIYQHFSSSYCFGICKLDGTELYELPPLPESHPEKWVEFGGKRFNYESSHTKELIFSSIKYWLEVLHIDGIRFDAARHMIDNRAQGWDLIKQANEIVHNCKYKGAFTIAEDTHSMIPTNYFNYDPEIFDYRWDFSTNTALFNWGEGYLQGHSLQYCLMGSIDSQLKQNNQILTFSHDERGNKLYQVMGGNFDKLRLAMTYMAILPGKKLNFMGNEFAQVTPPIGSQNEYSNLKINLPDSYDNGEVRPDAKGVIDWDKNYEGPHKDFAEFNKHLNHFYLKSPPLWSKEGEFGKGFIWIQHSDYHNNVLSFYREALDGSRYLCLNRFTNGEVIEDYKLDLSHLYVRNKYLNLIFSSNLMTDYPTPKVEVDVSSGFITSYSFKVPPYSSLIFEEKEI
jgi:1,4-alpha-glucan branching enzyme